MARKSLFESNYFKTIETVGPDERVMCVVYQHPFGIVFIYIATVACLLFALIGITFALPSLFDHSDAIYTLIALFSVIAVVAVGVLLAMSTVVYRQSKLTVTDRNIVQVVQKGILIRKVSRLSLANVEDVSSEQKGVFASMFNYGTLVIETAGEQANFIFNFCPNPHRVAKIILESKDDFLATTGQTGSFRNQVYAAQPARQSQR